MQNLKSTSRFAAIAIGLAAATFFPSRLLAKDECSIHTSALTLKGARITPKGDKPFFLNLSDVTATVRLPRHNKGGSEIAVSGPVSFQATHHNLWYRASSDYVSRDGVVTVSRGSYFVDVHLDGDAVVGFAVVSRSDHAASSGEEPQETVGPLDLTCDLLTLGGDEPQSQPHKKRPPSGSEVTQGGHFWRPKNQEGRVLFYAGPDASTTSRVLSNVSCADCLEFLQLGERGQWLLLERLGQGVRARGWMHRDSIAPIPYDGHVLGVGATCDDCDHSSYAFGEGMASGSAPAKRYEGLATLRAGTKVYASAGKGAWGEISKEVKVTVRHAEGDRWVQLWELPGITGAGQGPLGLYAFVPIEGVVFPSPSN